MKTDDSARNFGVPNFWTSPNLVKRNQAQLGICIEKTLYKYIYTHIIMCIYFYIHVYVCIYAVSINLMYVIYVHSLNYSSLAPY